MHNTISKTVRPLCLLAVISSGTLKAIQLDSLATASFEGNSTEIVQNIAASLEGDTADVGLTEPSGDGADKDLFTIDSNTGVLSFIAAPNYEIPGDLGRNNVYNITVQAIGRTKKRIQYITKKS